MYSDEALIAFCQKALQTPSYSGREEAMAKLLQDKMLELGFDEVTFDRLGNVIGTIHGKRPGKTVLLDGHMDTVDVIDREQWTHDPFGGEIEDGEIYGRGASDMKGSDCAMVMAAGRFAARGQRKTLRARSASPARCTRSASRASRPGKLQSASIRISSSSARRRPRASRSASGDGRRSWSRRRA